MNGWNPYSEEMKKMPNFYWLIAFRSTRYKAFREWKDGWEPQGELISSIIAPDNFKQYRDYVNKKETNEKQGLPDQIKMGDTTVATANTYFDPDRGLVNMQTGEILISREEFQKRSGIDGVAVSM